MATRLVAIPIGCRTSPDCWTADAILTPDQRIEALVTEALVTERTISYQYCKTSPSPTLVTVTNTDLTCEIKNNIDVIINNSLITHYHYF